MIEVKEVASSERTDIRPINSCITRYGWGCNKTWFITKNKRQVMPKGARLLMKLGCERTTLPFQTKDTYPMVGDVIGDTDGNKLLIVECELF